MSKNGFGHAIRSEWLLDENIFFLNHGSFGATPKAVLAAQDMWRRQLEQQPVYFMSKIFPDALRHAAQELASFLGTSGEQLAFVENATSGINAVLRSFPWNAGDEIIISNHLYTGVKNAVQFVSKYHGITVREIHIPFYQIDNGQITDLYLEAINSKTKLVLVDHIAAFSSFIFPVKQIAEACRERNVPVLVDGAHAAGMIKLDLEDLGVDWYAGNCHKWLFAPKGCAFLWRSAGNQIDLHPTVISNYYGKGFPLEFDWTGTRDPSNWLALSSALGFYRSLGEEKIRAYNHTLAVEAAGSLAKKWGINLPYSEEYYGSIVSLPLPQLNSSIQAVAIWIHDTLWDRHRIEVPVTCVEGQIYLRISAQIYNQISDYQLLGDVIPKLIEECKN